MTADGWPHWHGVSTSLAAAVMVMGSTCLRRDPGGVAWSDDWWPVPVRAAAPHSGDHLRPPGTLTASAGAGAGVLAVRYAWDRRCGERWAGRANTRADTAFVRLTDVALAPASTPRGPAVRYCESLTVPAAVTAEVAGLRAGEWVVVVEFGPLEGRGTRALVSRVRVW